MTREIAPGVILHKDFFLNANHGNAIGMFIWKVEITTMSVVDFEIILDESKNIELADAQGAWQATIKILPFKKQEVAVIYWYENWNLKSKFKLTLNVPDKSIQSKFIQEDEMKNHELMLESKNALEYVPWETLSQYDLKKIFNDKGITKFTDFEFPPNDYAIIAQQYEENINMFEYVIHWRRPDKFVLWEDNRNDDISTRPVFKIFQGNGPQPNDISFGMLPDQHLVSAWSAIAEKENWVKKWFKSVEVSRFGIYQIQLYLNGQWKTLFVDDLFPCIPMTNPMFTRSPSYEIWVLLLEKVLAKAFNSYYSLVHMNITDFLLVLTGWPTFYYLIDEQIKGSNHTDLVSKLMKYVVDNKYLVVAISKMPENESMDNSALTIGNSGYTILDVKKKGTESLICLRKIWFDCKKDEDIIEYQNKLGERYPDIKNDDMDGKMILRLNDFIKEFASFAVCYTRNWDEIRWKGKFIMNKESTGAKYEQCMSKWYYILKHTSTTTTVISLFQDEDKFRDNESRKQIMDISWSVFTWDSTTNEISHVQTLDFAHCPSLQMEITLPVGNYIILPRSSGCFMGKHVYSKSSRENGDLPLFDTNYQKFNVIFTNVIKDIFNKYDWKQLNVLNYPEFKALYETINKASISENDFQESVLQKYNHWDEGWTERGLVQYFESCYQDKGEAEIKKWLNNLGYDNELYCNKSRCFMWNFHSNNSTDIEVFDTINSGVNEKINKILWKQFGKVKENKGSRDVSPVVLMSKLNNIVTFGVKNKTVKRLKVKVNIKNMNDIVYNIEGELEKVVEANEVEYFGQFFSWYPDGWDSLQFNIETSNAGL